MTRLLYVNTTPRQCGVHAHGSTTADALRKSKRLQLCYAELPDDTQAHQLLAIIEQNAPDAIVYNWHVTAMSWLDDDFVAAVRRRFPRIEQMGIAHDAPPFALLSGIVHLDPTFEETYREFRVRRLVPEFAPHQQPPDNVVGWFGFAGPVKGIGRVIEQVNAEFDDAVLRLHVPFGHYGDRDGKQARGFVEECRRRAKPGIRVEATHDYKTTEQLLEWLSGNSVNCFLYDDVAGAGISSAIDYALAARRPIAVSDSRLFRHLHKLCPSARLAGRSLKEIIRDGFAPLEPVRRDWNEAGLIADYERIVETVVARGRAVDLTSNRVLTPADREALRPAIEELWALAPDVTCRKVPEAVFRNAFNFEQARRAVRKQDDILVVGGYEDPIGPALQKLGYRVRITDPALDGHDDRSLWNESLLETGRMYDIIIACSVMEHVPDDNSFIHHLYGLLKPGGVAFLTADYFQSRDLHAPAPEAPTRLYQSQRLRYIVRHVPDDSLLDVPAWGPSEPYFTFANVDCSFCSIAFRKRLRCSPSESFADCPLAYRIRVLHHNLVDKQKQIEQLTAQVDRLTARFASVEQAGPLTLKIAGTLHRFCKRLPFLGAAKNLVRRALRQALGKSVQVEGMTPP